MARAAGETVTIDGRRLRLSNLDKVMYPATGTTKAEVISYYVNVAEAMLPQVTDRPATRKRWVGGIGGEVFFEKNLHDAPSWVRRVNIQHKAHRNSYVVIDSMATLAWLGQVAALEIHTPQWRLDSAGQQLNPDRFVLDLDPGPGVGLAECVQVATVARDRLSELGLATVPVTSGGKGLHLYSDLPGDHDADYINAFAKQFAQMLEAELPDLVVSSQRKTERARKVLADWSQNNASKTTISPYSLRGQNQPTVAAPRTWAELEQSGLRQLTMTEVLERLASGIEPMRALGARDAAAGQPSGNFNECDDQGNGSLEPAVDRLTTYRSMRDGAKTPEPIPQGTPSVERAASGEPKFVIQQHRASRLHWDFRLEHDGVLVSWALPKGPPSVPDKNHLAVPTEDHPLEYASFEGTIPQGEYGAGQVSIWDFGSYVSDKWRDGEVIVTLTGQPGGPLGGRAKFALIRTASNWLIHRMALPDAARVNTALAQSVSKDSVSKDSVSKNSGTTEAGDFDRTRSATARREQNRNPAPSTGADRTEPFEGDERPMLAVPASPGDLADQSWAFESKWDGVRVLAYCDQQQVRLSGRSGLETTDTYPELCTVLAEFALDDTVLDGEIVALDETGAPSFSRLQTRIGLTWAGRIKAAQASTPVELYLFDVLRIDGTDTKQLSYENRRALLESLELGAPASSGSDQGGIVHTPPLLADKLETALARSRELGLEGVIAKRLDSTYRAGRRSSLWCKFKHQRMQEVVIVGWRPGRGERAGRIGSLLVAVPQRWLSERPERSQSSAGLVYAGRVGSGLSDATLAQLGRELAAIERDRPALAVPEPVARDAHWVEPRIIGEVSYGEWTADGQLRHPVWRGLRPDKSLGSITELDHWVRSLGEL